MFTTEAFIRKGVQSFEKGDFLVMLVDGIMHHAVGLYENDALFRTFGYPENKVGIKAFVFIESDSFASTLVA